MNSARLLLPDVQTLAELFDIVEECGGRDRPSFDPPCIGSTQYCLGPHLGIHGPKRFDYRWVRPTPRVMEVAVDMFKIVTDRAGLFFEIRVREHDALVSIKYNTILGSRWLTFLPLSEVPPEPLDCEIVDWFSQGA